MMEIIRQQWREAMALPDFKTNDRKMSEKQVMSACTKILKDVAKEFGYTGQMPVVVFDKYLDSYARSLKPTRENPGGVIQLSIDWFDRARDPEQGYQEFRIFAHEAIHALLQQETESYANTTQAINEGGAEILSVAYWAMNGPGYGNGNGQANPDRDAVHENRRGWVGGDVALTSGINYPEWIIETMKRAASKVGWDPKRIVDEVARVNKLNRNAVIDWLKETNKDIHFPGPETAEAMLLWMVRGLPVKRKAARGEFIRGVTGQVSRDVAQSIVNALNGGDKAKAGRLVCDWFASSQGGYNDSGGIGSWWGPGDVRNQIVYYAEGGNLYVDPSGQFAFPSYGKTSLGILLHGTPDGDKEPGGFQFHGDVQIASVEIYHRVGDEFSSKSSWVSCPVGKRYPMGR